MPLKSAIVQEPCTHYLTLRCIEQRGCTNAKQTVPPGFQHTSSPGSHRSFMCATRSVHITRHDFMCVFSWSPDARPGTTLLE